MQPRHSQDDHARLPADRAGEGAEAVDGGTPVSASAAVAIADEEPPAGADPPAAAARLPQRRRRRTASDGLDPSASGIASASPGPTTGWRASRVLANLDLILLVPAVAIALALGAAAAGVLIGAGAWILQRVLGAYDERWISGAEEPRARLGRSLFEAFGRIWLLAGAIVVAGVAGGHRDGLWAALTIFFAYSVAFVVRVLSGPPGARSSR
jgi:hypothetical protein